jgi:hypothetical protein
MEQNNKKQKENKGERKKFDFKKRFSEFRSKEFMKKYGASVYMSLALMVVVATAVGVFSLSYSYDDVGSIDIDVPDISIPDIDIPDFIPSQPEPEKPVDKPQSGIEEEPPVAKEYYFPVNGDIMKKYSVDALVFSQTLNDYRVHTGVDFASEAGSAVHAYTDGVILEIYDDPMMGKTVAIEHDYDLVSYYMNLDNVLPEGIAVGKNVKAGDVIGVVGKTALVEVGDDSHIHFELKVGGVTIDPEKELDGALKK